MLIRGENLKAKFIVSNRFASMVLFFSRNRCSIIVPPDISSDFARQLQS
jgi:hypothetical protein